MTPEIKDAANDSCQEPLVNIHVGDELECMYAHAVQAMTVFSGQEIDRLL
jgi:hypothetical protein